MRRRNAGTAIGDDQLPVARCAGAHGQGEFAVGRVLERVGDEVFGDLAQHAFVDRHARPRRRRHRDHADAARIQLHAVAPQQPIERIGKARAGVGTRRRRALARLQVFADVTQRILRAFADQGEVVRHAFGFAVVAEQQFAREQHAAQRILEVVRDQVHQFFPLGRDAREAVARQFQAHVGIHARQQFLGQERLGHVIDHARVERPQQHVAILRGGDKHHRRHRRRQGLQCLEYIEPVHAGHDHVEQDQVRRGFAITRQCFIAIAGPDNLVALPFQQAGNHAQVDRLVVDDKDAAVLGDGIHGMAKASEPSRADGTGP